MVLSLNDRQLLEGLKHLIAQHGYSPTIRELETHLGISSRSALQNTLERLRQQGCLTWQLGRARTYQLLAANLPLQGTIQAGYLVEHPTDTLEYVWVLPEHPGQRYLAQDYALKVCGDSMIDLQICQGDLVVMRPTNDLWSIKAGQVAAVWIEGEGATLKRLYYREGDASVILESGNQHCPRRQLSRHQIGLLGVLVSSPQNYWYSDRG
ncbi:repressor LexA [Halomicronema hongdechloris C2206]|uniref:Repressor LexA n=1 Tax=Halomicronema hongdechloris C2206 TaxID=1641165 RepID=A0A1Z3HGH0_9CYAN|nr:S24 family peptidase [Halomicronema hongdechloris]ASC69307.1 repressor LexA [Halomicronema hongdechloris C2206]